jgi:tetratricopeptide (TPR) repeat protein
MRKIAAFKMKIDPGRVLVRTRFCGLLLVTLAGFCLAAGPARLMAQDYEDYQDYEQDGEYQPESPPELEAAANAWHEALDLFDQGQFSAASELARLAATHFESFSRDDPDRFQPSQFSCLLLEVSSLRQVGEIEAALSRALALAEKLKKPIQTAPSLYLPVWAELSQELAECNYVFQRASGREERVLAYRRAAVSAYQALARENPDEFLPVLEDELSILILDCREFRRDEERARAIDQLLAASRLQALSQPGERPDLARNLAAYGEELALMGRRETALAALKEALALFGELERQTPGLYAVEIADTEFVLREQEKGPADGRP